jgi:hemoglobin-like flavoprotein
MGNQYGVVGEVLLASLGDVLGEFWTDKCVLAWVKIYSVMLSVIIPTAIEEEKKAFQQKRK